jgi:uncharacterized Zn finger protein
MKKRSRGRRRAAPANCLYQCEQCGTQEEIATEILAFFDVVDPGDPEAPATFRCQCCPGIMYPVWWFRAERATP